MKNPEFLKRLWINRRAVSRAVIELLMIAMVVVAAVGVYSVFTGVSAPTGARSQQHITIDSVSVTSPTAPFGLIAYVRNDGALTATTQAWYLYDASGSQVETGPLTDVIDVNAVNPVTIAGTGALDPGAMYKLRVVLITGIYAEYVFLA